MLNSDELGEKGESRFKEVCADAKLICNKADRDRTGWDFIVEFPFEEISSTTLDNRHTPISCHVQVKTIFETTKNVSMRLSSAERIAKELKPSFVYVFKVNTDLEFTDAFLIHLLDDRLGAILMRLRQEEAKGTASKKLNKKTISLVPSLSERLAPTGAALAAAISKVCSGGMREYVKKKEIQLEKLGFDERPYEGKATLHLSNHEELADVFLGIKQVSATDFRVFHNRFGIRLPYQESVDGKLKIQPNPADDCSLMVRKDSLSPPAIFKGKLYLPAIRLPKESRKFLLMFQLFSVTVQPKNDQVAFEINFKNNGQCASLGVWANFFHLIEALSSGQGSIEIIPKKIKGKMRLEITPYDIGVSSDYSKFLIEICEKAEYLFNRAGVDSLSQINFEDIENNSTDIIFANALMKNESPSISFSTVRNADLDKATSETHIFAKIFIIRDVIIAYYGMVNFSVTIEDDKIRWTSQNFFPRAIKEISDTTEFDEFVDEAMKIENSKNVLRFEAELPPPSSDRTEEASCDI